MRHKRKALRAKSIVLFMVCWIIVLVDLSTGNNLGITSFLSIYFPWKWRSSKNRTLRWFQADFRTMFKNSSGWLLQHEPHSFTPLYILTARTKKPLRRGKVMLLTLYTSKLIENFIPRRAHLDVLEARIPKKESFLRMTYHAGFAGHERFYSTNIWMWLYSTTSSFNL